MLSIVDGPQYGIFAFEASTLRGLLRFLTWCVPVRGWIWLTRRHGEARLEPAVADLERTKGTKPYLIALSIVTRPNSIRLDIQMLPVDAKRPPAYATIGSQRRFGMSTLQQLPISLALLATTVLDVSRQAQRAYREEPLGQLAAEFEKRALEAGEDVRAHAARLLLTSQIARERVQEVRLQSVLVPG